MAVLHGVDISAYQSGPPSGKDFYVIKATEGLTYVNSEFPAWLSQVQGWGKLAGVYHFAHPTNDPTAEANYFLNHIRPHLTPGMLVCLDHETATGSASHDAAWANTFQHRVKAALPAWTPVTYCNQSFATSGRCAGLGWTALWLARYAAVTSAGIGPWSKSTMQQYTSSPEDEDVFFGTAADWRALGGASAAPSPTPVQEDIMRGGQLPTGADAELTISVHGGAYKAIGFAVGKGQTAQITVSVQHNTTGEWWDDPQNPVTLNGDKPKFTVALAQSDIGAISVTRADAGTVSVGWDVS